MEEHADAAVKVLGSGCAKCNALEEVTRQALTELGMEPVVGHITDFAQIAAYGVMTTPALVVDGKVLSYIGLTTYTPKGIMKGKNLWGYRRCQL